MKKEINTNETIYDRIQELCERKEMTIGKLEIELGFGNSAIRRWGKISSPTITNVAKVARYFHVSIDYLAGLTDIETPADMILKDPDIISFQRASKKMSQNDKQRMMKMLRIGFDYAFDDQKDDK